uniref:meiotic recombination protein REC114 isoform X2 n=1 Tax=Gasterosteus aculeatus aculeatus TaxID=481459 RepID=UPI001A980EB5|nr:meiotic recombination protein REC114 isoform X2 [Gasterosteus aculeatus aculeatus]
MSACQSWRLTRYGRFVPGSTGEQPWKIFEAKDNKPGIFLTIVGSGYLLVLQGQESLDTIPLFGESHFLKVQQKSDNLMFRFTLQGESRMSRMQFGGRCRAEAIKECSSALEKLQEYTSVSTHDDTPSPAKPPPPAEASAPVIQTGRGKAVEVDAEGSLSIRSLTQRLLDRPQHILGETVVSLPRVYHQGSLVQVDFEPILRVCLLDPSFPAFVEEMEGELEKLLEE